MGFKYWKDGNHQHNSQIKTHKNAIIQLKVWSLKLFFPFLEDSFTKVSFLGVISTGGVGRAL